ncbi:MAG: hypothetical protein K9J12_04600 [Melioribacteraceae bacterium]|nr:hypothetical protein [Melioribacteraceae bacterium]MCF8266160.1 hypothetical protein [Melioribacteraceae bacterium]MCF8431643.1 hypothetical protein [Melioribacteraceae bacterium]
MNKKKFQSYLTIPVMVTFVLWMIAITLSMLVLDETEYFGQIAPVFFICMVGNIITVQKTGEGKFSRISKKI